MLQSYVEAEWIIGDLQNSEEKYWQTVLNMT